jgi:hypothetical protein
MAYGINAPVGLVPHSYLNGQPYTGALTSFPLFSGTAGNIFIGDPVVLNANGGIQVFNPSGQAGGATPILGVFMGCKYQAYNNGELSVVRSPYWIGGTQTFPAGGANPTAVGVPAEAMIVIAENNLLFDIQVSTSLTSSTTQNLTTTYAGAASGIIGQYLPLAIGVTNVTGTAGTTIPTNVAYYADGSPLLPNPTTGNMATGLSAMYADIGAAANGNFGLGASTLSTGYCLQVVRLTERIDQVSYPNLWSGFANSFAINTATTPNSVSAGSFNNVLVQINNQAI